MIPASTVGDLHICPKHGPGQVQSPGDETVRIGKLKRNAARTGDSVTCPGGPSARIITGSKTVRIGGRNRHAARHGSRTNHYGLINLVLEQSVRMDGVREDSTIAVYHTKFRARLVGADHWKSSKDVKVFRVPIHLQDGNLYVEIHDIESNKTYLLHYDAYKSLAGPWTDDGDDSDPYECVGEWKEFSASGDFEGDAIASTENEFTTGPDLRIRSDGPRGPAGEWEVRGIKPGECHDISNFDVFHGHWGGDIRYVKGSEQEFTPDAE